MNMTRMTRRLLCAAAVVALAAAVATGTAGAITPANGGDAGGTTITINSGPGDQTDPHVSGDLAVYTDIPGSTSTIRYYNFVSASDQAVPNGGEIDFLSDVNGSKIGFSRQSADGTTTASMVFDVPSMTLTNVAPAAGSSRFGVVLGGSTVAFQELNSGNGDIFVYDMSTSGPLTNVSASPDLEQNASISPAGNAVVWERCVGSNCGIYRSVNTGSGFGSPELVSDTLSNEGNPDTDGTTVVYDSERPSATGKDIYFQPLTGGTETELQLAGDQRNPSISSGVVAFESKDTVLSNADLFVYVIAMNTLYRVTDTPTVEESLNDVSVLSNGVVRVVWAADDDIGGNHNIYARTFSPRASGVFTAAVQQPINADGSSVFKAGKGVVPVKFSLAVDGVPTCTLPAATIALTRLTGAVTGPVNESEFVMPADSDSSFRIDSCQYVYNLSLKSLSAGTYRVEIKIGGQVVGSANLELR
jgi:hypothetical protein